MWFWFVLVYLNCSVDMGSLSSMDLISLPKIHLSLDPHLVCNVKHPLFSLCALVVSHSCLPAHGGAAWVLLDGTPMGRQGGIELSFCGHPQSWPQDLLIYVFPKAHRPCLEVDGLDFVHPWALFALLELYCYRWELRRKPSMTQNKTGWHSKQLEYGGYRYYSLLIDFMQK